MESWYNGDMTTDALLNEYAVRLHLAEKIHSATGISLFAYDFRWEYRADEDRYPLKFFITDSDENARFSVDVNPTVVKDT